VRRLYGISAMPDWGWRVVAGIPEAVVLAPSRNALRRTSAGLGLMAVLLLGLAWWLSRRLVAPLRHLSATARAVAEGQPHARADEHLPGELGAVAAEFNRMLDGRDRAQARLGESERRFREMLDTVELFAIAVDREGRFTYCNDFFLRHTGWRLDELNGDDYGVRCIPPERSDRVEQWRSAVREGRAPTHSESDLLTRSGERRLVRWSSTVLRDEQGQVVGRASIGADVTDQRRAERQVQRLSGFLAALSRTQRAIIHRAERGALLQQACDACVDAGQARIASAWWLFDDSLTAVAWAGPAESLFGPMPARRDTQAPGFAATLAGRALLQGQAGVGNALPPPPQANEPAPAAIVCAEAVFPLRRAGKVVGVLMLHVDEADWFDQALVDLLRQLADELTFALDNLAREEGRLQAEERLATRERQLAGVVETAMDAIVTCDAEQRVVMFNRAAAELFGVPAEQVLGRPMDDLVPIEFRERHRRGMEAFIRGARDEATLGRDRLLYAERADGERFPFEAAVSRQGEGAQMTLTAVIRDLRERQAAEAAREARVAAEAASRAKTEFLSRMSHELRTPLNAMLGFAQLLSNDPRDPLSARQQRHLALTREAGWHLLALIDDVLDVSRIEAGELEMLIQPVALQPLIESALSVSTALADRHQVRLAPAPVLPPGLAVLADATRLRQVVLNLLSNGCKYNRPGGRVAIEVITVGADPGDPLCLDVVDDGVGMSAAQLQRLFEPFNRLGREQGPIEGTGIGLHLSRHLAQKMGARIEVDSAPGHGTRMRLVLARADLHVPAPGLAADGPAAALPIPGAAAPDDALRGRVLYIEDNPVNLMLVEQFLLRWPAVELAGATTADGGLARLRGERFDLVLLDMQLPDMHGTELLRQLRREGLLDGAPVVALSASAMPEAVNAALSAGAAEYWTKPLDLGRMGADLRRFLRAAA
jgi:PAS domain S-box-containing protein